MNTPLLRPNVNITTKLWKLMYDKTRDTGYLFSSLLDQLIFYYTFHSRLVLPILAVQFGSCEGTGKQTGSNVAANTSC